MANKIPLGPAPTSIRGTLGTGLVAIQIVGSAVPLKEVGAMFAFCDAVALLVSRRPVLARLPHTAVRRSARS